MKKNYSIVINDYVENTDIDIWIQLKENNVKYVKYYPVSKRMDQEKMMIFLKNEKERQRQRD